MNVTDTNSNADDWSAVAAGWDEHVDTVDDLSAAAIEAMVGRAQVTAGDQVLELAAGPGTLGPTWSQLVGPGGRVVLSDIAPAMVEVARRRTAHLPNVDLAVVDATSIQFPAEHFDVVACRMGLMFVPEPAAAFAEIHRVLVGGGRLGAMTWAGMEHNPWMTCVGMAGMMNGIVAGGPPVGPGSIFSLSDPDHLAGLAAAAGFADVHVDELEIVFRADDVNAHIDRVSALAGPLAGAIRDASPEQRDAFRRTAAELAAPYMGEHELAIPGRALLVSGVR